MNTGGRHDDGNVPPLRPDARAVDTEFDMLMRRFEQLGQPQLDALYSEAEQARNADLNAVMRPAVVRTLPRLARRVDASDADLIDGVRAGNVETYGKLYERHVRSANILAMQFSTSTADADDLVAEAFAKVLAALRSGGGPGAAFRPFLLTAVRLAAYDRTRREKRLKLAGDIGDVPGAARASSMPFGDKAQEDLDQTMVATAFATLPERWQTVLWHTAIEGQSPRDIAPLVGLTANGVSVMTFRAREGLRKALLQAHVVNEPAETCRATVTKLGAWTRGSLKKRKVVQLNAHMDDCAECRKLAGELSDVNGTLRGLVAPMVLGTGTAGYLAACAGDSAAMRISASSGFRVAAVAVAAAVLGASGVISSGGPSYNPSVASTVTSGSAPTTGASTVSRSATGPTPAVPPESTNLTLTAPTEISMAIGGSPNELNISITNNGNSPTTLPTLTLTLPEEIEAVGPGKTPVGVVGCPAGSRIVTCEGGQALAPGQTQTFRVRLQAERKTGARAITGTAGRFAVSIPTTVAAAHG
ncbi:RNA polymerase sigma factor [Lentzea sp. NPDC059081]|uniref:RNA polymerase sigma factor n=1 Tax=Lentzea sp. NPDC059081 TaxID=3346719 RepID=UPI0036ACF925